MDYKAWEVQKSTSYEAKAHKNAMKSVIIHQDESSNYAWNELNWGI